MKDEMILCIPRNKFEPYNDRLDGMFEAISAFYQSKNEHILKEFVASIESLKPGKNLQAILLSTLVAVVGEYGVLKPRSEVEGNDDFIQLVSYIILADSETDNFLAYTRNVKDGESRLRARKAFIGGHVNADDIRCAELARRSSLNKFGYTCFEDRIKIDCPENPDETIVQAVRETGVMILNTFKSTTLRELHEEIVTEEIIDHNSILINGYMYNSDSQVNREHLCIINIVPISGSKFIGMREGQDYEFMSVEDIMNSDDCEDWVKLSFLRVHEIKAVQNIINEVSENDS